LTDCDPLHVNVLRRKSPQRLTFSSIDRLVFAGLYRLAPGVLAAFVNRRGIPTPIGEPSH
jgi:hypothetical protein